MKMFLRLSIVLLLLFSVWGGYYFLTITDKSFDLPNKSEKNTFNAPSLQQLPLDVSTDNNADLRSPVPVIDKKVINETSWAARPEQRKQSHQQPEVQIMPDGSKRIALNGRLHTATVAKKDKDGNLILLESRTPLTISK